jgi:tryptophan synthase alpha chain
MTSRIMAHMVASYPDRARSVDVARAIIDGGASILEVQFPFSDPMADGPDIQAACSRALEAGFTVADGFHLVAEIARGSRVPVFIMSYANLLFARGVERFLLETKNAGGAGVIVPDLPPDYDEGLFAAAAGLGIEAMPVLSPSMSAARIERVASLGARSVYATLRTGTTGAFTSIDPSSLDFLQRLGAMRSAEKVRILAGFGISTRRQVVAVQDRVYAVVVGSALVREVAASRDGFTAVREKMIELSRG